MKKLIELVAAGLLLAGCSTNNSQKPEQNLAPAIQESKPKPIRNDVIDPLRDFVYAGYDNSIGTKRDVAPLETNLENAVKNALGAEAASEVMQNLREGKRAKPLEAFFEEQGLQFRCISFDGPIKRISYELLKVDSREQKEMTLFGITQKYTKVRVKDPELITNWFTYAAQKKDLKTPGVTGTHWVGTDIIEYRTYHLDFLANNYFEGEKAQWDELEGEAKDYKQLDKYFGKKKQIFKLFMDHMGTLLHHIGVRDLYKSSKDAADFKSKVAPLWERDMDIRNVMMLIDEFEYEPEILEKLTRENRIRLAVDTQGQKETRSLLAQIIYGSSPHQYLGDMFKTSANNFTDQMAMQQMASFAVLNLFLLQTIAERDKYASIDAKGYTPGQEGAIYEQFGNLTEKQITGLAQLTYDRLYKGKSLREHMQTKLDELMQSQK